MQISFDLKSLELLGVFGKGRLQFNEDLEFFGIPKESSATQTTHNLRKVEFLGNSGNLKFETVLMP